MALAQKDGRGPARSSELRRQRMDGVMKKKRGQEHPDGALRLPVPKESLNARPDPIDFRDKIYVPTLVEVPTRVTLEDYRAHYARKNGRLEILNQGKEGACTGFGLAAVANFLLCCRRGSKPGVSPRMFYEMARR